MLTADQIDGIIYRIQEFRKKQLDDTVGQYVTYLNANDIEVEFTEEGVVWKRKTNA